MRIGAQYNRAARLWNPSRDCRVPRVVLFCLLSAATLMQGCTTPLHGPPQVAQSWTRTELVFGLSRADGSVIAERCWQQFVEQQITPRFVDGFTLIPASGQWTMNDGRTLRENARILLLVYPDSAAVNTRIEQVRIAYMTRFNQEAVLRISQPATVSLRPHAKGRGEK